MSPVNAVLTPRTRLRLARMIVDGKHPVRHVAKLFMVSPVTARKWADRYRAEGATGMKDRSSRPHGIPHRTSEHMKRKIIALRWRQRLGPAQIAARTSPTAADGASSANSKATGTVRPPPAERGSATVGQNPASAPRSSISSSMTTLASPMPRSIPTRKPSPRSASSNARRRVSSCDGVCGTASRRGCRVPDGRRGRVVRTCHRRAEQCAERPRGHDRA